jgi:hypothetical protein
VDDLRIRLAGEKARVAANIIVIAISDVKAGRISDGGGKM